MGGWLGVVWVSGGWDAGGVGGWGWGLGRGASPNKPASASKLFFPLETDHSQRQTYIAQ